MATVAEIPPTLDALTDHISASLGTPVTRDKVHVEYYSHDDRIGWNTYIVTVADLGVWGFTDGPVTGIQG